VGSGVLPVSGADTNDAPVNGRACLVAIIVGLIHRMSGQGARTEYFSANDRNCNG